MKLGMWSGIGKPLATILSGGASAPVTYSISGTVYDADGSTAVASATVALGALTATSGADGTYTISNIPAGTSGSMTCTKTGYSWAAITVAAMAANLTAQNYTNAWYAGGGSLASCAGAWRGRGAADKATSYVNLANPGTNNLTEVGATAPTWDAANGWKGSTGIGALSTGLIAANNTWTYAVRFTNSPGDACAMGWTNGQQVQITPNLSTGGPAHRYIHGGTLATGAVVQSGVMLIAGPNCYLNGVADGTITQAAVTAIACYLLARNNSGTASSIFVNGYVQVAGMWNKTLSPTEAAQVSAGMAAVP